MSTIGDNEAQIAALLDLDENLEDVSETDHSVSDSDIEIIEDNSVVSDVSRVPDTVRDTNDEDWFDKEALLLGRCFGAAQAEEIGTKTLLLELNLNFRTNGKAEKGVSIVGGATVEGGDVPRVGS